MESDLQRRVQRIAARRSAMWTYRFLRRFIIMVLFPYFRVRHRGSEHLDIAGPVILAAVHRSNLDGPLIGAVARRRMRALAKQSLFPNRPAAAFMASVGAFPVRRGAADREAIRAAMRILRSGELMIVFPEGSRQSGPKVTGVFDGVSYLASKTNAAVVPVGIAGTEAAMATGKRLPARTPVAIVAGEPMHLPEGRMRRKQLTQFSQLLAQRLQAVFDEAQSMVRQTPK